MARSFKETAHLNTDKEKFNEGWDRIFKNKKNKELKSKFKVTASIETYKKSQDVISSLEKLGFINITVE